jgi:hypothetical protein
MSPIPQFESLRALDYLALAAAEPSPESARPLEAYLYLRSLVVLGRHQCARAGLARHGDSLRPWGLDRLLRGQLAAIALVDLDEARRSLDASPADATRLPYLAGEWEQTRGIVAFQDSRFAEASRHYELALGHYRSADLPAHAAIAAFNLGVCGNHLNRPTAMTGALSELEELERRSGNPAVRLHLRRLEAYQALRREDTPGAERAFAETQTLALALGRQRDAESSLSYRIYLRLKQEKAGAELFAEADRLFPRPTNTPFAQRFAELRRWSGVSFIEPRAARRTLERWGKDLSDAESRFMLCDLLLSALGQAQDYETLERLYRQLGEEPAYGRQALLTIDLRYHGILGMMKTGKLEAARRLLLAYQSDAREDRAEAKLAKAQRLQEIWPLEHSQGGSPRLVLDRDRHRLVGPSSEHDLSKYPTLERCLDRLAARDGREEPAALFTALYGDEYLPHRHQARLFSLLHRVRRLLPEGVTLQSRDGWIELQPRLALRARGAPELSTPVLRRQEALLRLIVDKSDGISLAELFKANPISRRTLQRDLEQLVRAGRLIRMGNTRRARYRHYSGERQC